MTERDRILLEARLMADDIAKGKSPSRIALEYALETGRDLQEAKADACFTAMFLEWLMFRDCVGLTPGKILERSRKFLETYPGFLHKDAFGYALTYAKARDRFGRTDAGVSYQDFVRKVMAK